MHEAENHRISLEEQIERLKQQHNALNDFYTREITNLNHIHQLVKNLCGNNYLLISDYDRYAKQWQLIKQNQMNHSYLQPFMFQIDQILQQQDSLNGMNDREDIHRRSGRYLESKMSVSMMVDVLPLVKQEKTTECNFFEERMNIVRRFFVF